MHACMGDTYNVNIVWVESTDEEQHIFTEAVDKVKLRNTHVLAKDLDDFTSTKKFASTNMLQQKLCRMGV